MPMKALLCIPILVFPGSLMVKDLVLSLLWLGFDPWLRSFRMLWVQVPPKLLILQMERLRGRELTQLSQGHVLIREGVRGPG